MGGSGAVCDLNPPGLFARDRSERLEKAGTVDFKMRPARKVGTRSGQRRPNVRGRFAFPGARNPRICCICQRFRKGVGGRGLATNSTQNTANILPQNCVLLLIRGHRERGADKGPESTVWEGFPCANPLCPPTPS